MLNKLLLFVLCCNYCAAQLPDTDLWLFDIENKKGAFSIKNGANITNRQGYDNQPAFSEDEKKIFYVSIRDDKQADIYIHSIGNKKNIRLTTTNESEYSPTLTSKKNIITCVTVLKDSSQVILPYDLKTGNTSTYSANPETLINSFDSVGYFSFLNSDTIIYYKLTHPHSLHAFSVSKNTDAFLGYNPVRGFKKINRHQFIYGIKDTLKVCFYKYNALLSKAEKYSEYNSQNEDIIWHTALGLLKSEGPAILQFNEKENKWQQLFDFSSSGIKKITRFVIDSKIKKIVVVNNL